MAGFTSQVEAGKDIHAVETAGILEDFESQYGEIPYGRAVALLFTDGVLIACRTELDAWDITAVKCKAVHLKDSIDRVLKSEE